MKKLTHNEGKWLSQARKWQAHIQIKRDTKIMVTDHMSITFQQVWSNFRIAWHPLPHHPAFIPSGSPSDNSVLIAKDSESCCQTYRDTSPNRRFFRYHCNANTVGIWETLRPAFLESDGCHLATEMDLKNILPYCTKYLVTEFVISGTSVKNYDLCPFSLTPLSAPHKVYIYIFCKGKHQKEPSCGISSECIQRLDRDSKENVSHGYCVKPISLLWNGFSSTLGAVAFTQPKTPAETVSWVLNNTKAHNLSFKL